MSFVHLGIQAGDAAFQGSALAGSDRVADESVVASRCTAQSVTQVHMEETQPDTRGTPIFFEATVKSLCLWTGFG